VPLIWEEVESLLAVHREQLIATGQPTLINPATEGPGIEICFLLNDRLGTDFALSEFLRSPADPLQYLLRATDADEQRSRAQQLPWQSPWRAAKGIHC
jgi:hypothetical protein